MIKYVFKVFDTVTKEEKASVITTVDMMLDTLSQLSQLGIVKGYIINSDVESEVEK